MTNPAPSRWPKTRYRQKLDAKEHPIGGFCCMDGFTVHHMMAVAGFDFLVFDRQHAAYSWPELEQICIRVRSAGCAAFIRVGSCEEAEINLALDLPIDGIVLPNLDSLAAAKKALSYTRFPPNGIRSLGNERNDVIFGAYGEPDAIVGILVEHPGAVAEIDAILATGQIRFTWVGSHDLSALMGLDPHKAFGPQGVDPELQAAMDRVKAASNKADVPFWGAAPHADCWFGGVDARLVHGASLAAVNDLRSKHGK